MITVHHLENSRSQRVLWLLEELEVPYEVKRYERDKKTMLAPPALKAVHPLGKSPVITDGHGRRSARLSSTLDRWGVHGACATRTGCTTPRARSCRFSS
jgi:glutathione S-transferase